MDGSGTRVAHGRTNGCAEPNSLRTMSSTLLLEPVSAPPDPYQRYRRALLSPERVRQLSELRPAIAVRDTLWLWSQILVAWSLIAYLPRWWAALIAIPFVAARFYALLIVGHDGIHRRLFRSPRWNDWFSDLCVFGPVGGITRINNQNHLGHHRHLSTPGDPDLHQFTCTNKYHWLLLLGYLTGVTSLWRSFQKVFLRRTQLREAQLGMNGTSGRYTVRDILLIGLWQTALIAGLTYFVAWWAYPVLWLVPIYLAFAADNFRAFCEHSQPRPEPWANEHRLITFLSNPVERLFVAPLNMNYHAAHHLWPSVPYYNLPQADAEIRNHPAASGMEWRGTYFGYLLRYFRLLPLEECSDAAHVSV